ncbi:ParB N-terminal domain-containing protein [Polymorphospora sp. NPDC050346]|uniref:ParB/RepB/Spo0J family partition protein n=1 Tax=Polymorphospora sp. NPDC050346 TaxID=3155780 RepID=UPI0033E76E95
MATTTAHEPQAADVLPGSYKLLELAAIEVNTHNVRDDAQALPGIVQNLQTDGVAGLVSPIVVTPIGDNRYRLIDGEQRYWSAVEANQTVIQAIVRADLFGTREQIINMLRQVHRTDPNATQLAHGIQQLALAGMDAAEIARSTGYRPEQVTAARAVASLDNATAGRAKELGLDLTQMAVLADFAGDTEVVDALTEAAEEGPFAFARAAEHARATRATHEALTARIDELRRAGVKVLTDRLFYHDPKAKEITDLRDNNGQRITPDAHATCPGRAVALYDRYGVPTEAECCMDWRTHGHTAYTYDYTSNARRGPMTEEDKAERRKVIENNKQMDAANAVRRDWLAGLLAAKTPPKGTSKLIAQVLTDGHTLDTWIRNGRPMLDDLLNPSKRKGTKRVPAKLSDARYTVISLTAVAAAFESAIDRTTWRTPTETLATWLQWCVLNGFQIGPVEQLIIDTVEQRKAPSRPTLNLVTTDDRGSVDDQATTPAPDGGHELTDISLPANQDGTDDRGSVDDQATTPAPDGGHELTDISLAA